MSERGDQAQLRHEEYRDDRYVAALRLDQGDTARLYYLVRAVTPGSHTVPPPQHLRLAMYCKADAALRGGAVVQAPSLRATRAGRPGAYGPVARLAAAACTSSPMTWSRRSS